MPQRGLAISCTMADMERELTHLHIEAGPNGWVTAYWRRGARSREHTARIRFERQTNGWWRWEDVFESRLAREDDVPLHRIELAVNAHDEVTETLEQWLDEPSPVNFDDAVRQVLRRVPRKPFKKPRGRNLDEGFYRKVAFAYRDAVRRGLDPVKTIAADTNKPVSTVNRWVGEARRLEYLPPTDPGRVTV